jgi:hypothetical protein
MQLYKQFMNKNRKQNHLQFVTTSELGDNIVVCHYRGFIDQKDQEIKIIKHSSSENDNDLHFNHIIDSLDKRNHIVHCSLVTQDDNRMVDLTSVIREFVYHFDKDDEWSKMEHFFKYVSECYDLGEYHKDMYLVIYLNDETFTEIKHKVEEITTLQFKEVLRLH